jgi:hypothetical protein
MYAFDEVLKYAVSCFPLNIRKSDKVFQIKMSDFKGIHFYGIFIVLYDSVFEKLNKPQFSKILMNSVTKLMNLN